MFRNKTTSNRVTIRRILKPVVSLVGMWISKLQVFNSVVVSSVINVVNKFVSFKISSNFLFHNKTVFINIPLWSIGERVFWRINKNIANGGFNSSTLPNMRPSSPVVISDPATFERTFWRAKESSCRFFKSVTGQAKFFVTNITFQKGSRPTVFTGISTQNNSFHRTDYIQKKEGFQVGIL